MGAILKFSIILLLICCWSMLTDGQFEVFVFLLKAEQDLWQKIEWTKVTTLCLVGWVNPDLTEFAHSQGVKVVFIGEKYPVNQLTNRTSRKHWVQRQVEYAKLHHLDGVNFDLEDDLSKDSPEAKGYTKLFKSTVTQFHHEIPGSQVSIDVAWSPGGIDGRFYDYKSLGRHADLVFIMSYDEQSQMWEEERCRARPNSPLIKTFTGIQRYLQLGLTSSKLILGVPWYGYRYPCQELVDDVCYIKEVPFRGCNCTDAAGREFPYSSILKMLSKSTRGRRWDVKSKTPWFNYKDSNQTYQVWYDDPQSLSVKYQVATGMGLGGVGFWTGNFLDYSNDSMINSMWNIVP